MKDKYSTFKNIFSILILLVLFFIISNIKNLNDFVLKKNIQLLIFCIIIYLIYIKVDLLLLVICISIFILYNIKLDKNTYLNYIHEKIKLFSNNENNFFSNNEKKESFKNNNSSNKNNEMKEMKELEFKMDQLKNFSNNFDFKPYAKIDNNNLDNNNLDNNNLDNNNLDNNIYKKNKKLIIEQDNVNKNIEPFKGDVENLKNLFNEIESNFKNNI